MDDNAQNRALAVATLAEKGYQIVTASNGEEALTLAARELPDCVLMDVRMPRVDGIAACERIRSLPDGRGVAIVFVTAQRDVETFDRALAAGGDDFITKPFRSDELAMRVQTALKLRRIASERSELFEQLKHQRDHLQRLELQKEQLVAFLVHDLKNPVNAVDLQAQLVLRTPDVDRAHRAALRIRDETHALMRMITNLLDISRADEGRFAPVMRTVDVVTLVRSVLDELSLRAQSARVRIQADIRATEIKVDADLMSRVLANLIDNAIRYAPEDTDVRVSIAPVRGGVELRVADAGQGIPEDQRELVFERFRSGAEATRTNRGLGLAFCKLVVEAHGGTIWIEDGSPGTVFCVRLADAN